MATRAPKNMHERRRSNSPAYAPVIASCGFDRDRIDDRIGKPGPTIRDVMRSPFAQPFFRRIFKESLYVRLLRISH